LNAGLERELKFAQKSAEHHVKALEKVEQKIDSPNSKLKSMGNDLRVERDRVYKLKE